MHRCVRCVSLARDVCRGVPFQPMQGECVVMSFRILSLAVIAWCLAACASTVTPAGEAHACALPNGSTCAAGATCPAGDGCNQCSCGADGSVRCTQQACASTDAGVDATDAMP